MNRRGFLTGGATLLVAAPAIVRFSSLMPVKVMPRTLKFAYAGDSTMWRASAWVCDKDTKIWEYVKGRTIIRGDSITLLFI